MQPFLHWAFARIFRLTFILAVLMLLGLILVIQFRENDFIIVFIILFIVCSALAFSSYKVRCFFSPEGRRMRIIRKFEEHEARIKQREYNKREKISYKSSAKNIRELIRVTAKELKYRRSDITPNIFSQIEQILKKSERELDFYFIYNLYNVTTSVDIPRLNEELKGCLAPTTQHKGE